MRFLSRRWMGKSLTHEMAGWLSKPVGMKIVERTNGHLVRTGFKFWNTTRYWPYVTSSPFVTSVQASQSQKARRSKGFLLCSTLTKIGKERPQVYKILSHVDSPDKPVIHYFSIGLDLQILSILAPDRHAVHARRSNHRHCHKLLHHMDNDML